MAGKKKAAAEVATAPTCMVDGCDRPVHLRGLCQEHWDNPK